MRLKRVQLFGFKTFADRTEFTLDGGIVAVVGPNGCGKSNIVDAILWGLGEGNARHLRAQNSQDVIFSGSARRKSVGFAEVTLVFDNEDRKLPVDTSEVAITRKLTRGGDSDYAINRKSCRLKDIHDLLADTGLGRAGYSIVGQKEIDQALAASPLDRRSWVDEAAGVQRYRGRKVESLKRLASAQENLQRVQDILRELEAQREPMREEAELAARYRNLRDSLQGIEQGLLIQEVAQALVDIRECEERIASSLNLSRDEVVRAERVEATIQQLQQDLRALEAEAERLRHQLQEAISKKDRAKADGELIEEKLRGLDSLEATLNSNEDESIQRRQEAESEVASLTAEEEQERNNLTQLEVEVGGLDSRTKELSAELNEVEKGLAKAREAESERMRHVAESAHRKDRLKEINRELSGIEATLPDLVAGIEEQEKEVEKVKSLPAELRTQNKRSEDELVMLRQQEEKLAQELRKSLSDRSILEGRIRGIEATIDAHEGLAQGTRAVLDAVRQDRLQGEYVPVGEAISTSKENALAIETALGGSINDLIVDSERDAKAAIQYLKQNRLGRATFQPLTLMRNQDVSSDLRRLLNERKIVGRASALVDVEEKYRPVIESLLGRVVIAEDLDTALQFAKTTGWSRMVTLDGEVIFSSGAVSGGAQNRGGYGIVQRKADLEELEGQVRSLNREIKESEARVSNLGRSRQALQLSLQENQAKLKGLDGEVREADDYLRVLKRELEETEKVKTRLESEKAKLSSEMPKPVEEVNLADWEARRDAVLKELAARSADNDLAESRLRDAADRVRQAQARLVGAKRRLEAANEAIEGRSKRLVQLGPEREKLREELAKTHKRVEEAEQHIEEANNRLASLQERREAMLAEREKFEGEVKAIRDNVSTMAEAAHQAELTRARAESKRVNSCQRLLEEYGLTEEDAYAQREMVEIPADAQAVVSRLRRDMKSMGDVNLGAIEAYERLTVRYEELETQLEDITKGIEQVMASIKELDGLTRDKFVTTFSQVQAEFRQLFTQLFGGGEGDLILSEPSSILETGIDIEVQLPGKKRQRLELLSGGERALCATAFLFALLRVKPSPLVVLDEVDAPLDGRNVERFAEVLHEFSQAMQFIVITHNPTTIERAPIWLGVTMSEPGVSTLVPVRVPEGEGAKVPSGV